MTSFPNKLKRLIGRTSRPVHTWRSVHAGPLAGLWLYLPDASWAERFLTGEYEPETLAAMAMLAGCGGTLYDVGAHIGYYTCAWLHMGGSRVEAFEPTPYNRDILMETIKRNGLESKVRVHNVALGDSDRHGTMIASQHDIGASSAAYLDGTGSIDLPPGAARPLPALQSSNVTVRRLDTYSSELGLPAPDVIKLDIEGAEWAALLGMGDLLDTHPALLCEVHNTEVGVKIADRLATLGYEMSVLGKNGPHVSCLWQMRG